jgi:septum formation protein
MQFILASQSPYRKALLERVGFNFLAMSPKVDEESLKKQAVNSARELCERLAQAKAMSISIDYPDTLVIGSDQLLNFKGQILGKSYGFEKAFEQLRQLQGEEHELLTSVAIYKGATKIETWTNTAKMKMKKLTDQQITSYLKQDQPYDCSGSYKIERGGIKLFDAIECSDWSSIEGLPLIKLCQILNLNGIF